MNRTFAGVLLGIDPRPAAAFFRAYSRQLTLWPWLAAYLTMRWPPWSRDDSWRGITYELKSPTETVILSAVGLVSRSMFMFVVFLINAVLSPVNSALSHIEKTV